MFKFLLAFLVWLFATGKYSDWAALITSSLKPSTSGASGSTTGSAAGSTSGSTPDLSGIMGALGSLSGNSATDSQLLGPASFSPADSGVPK